MSLRYSFDREAFAGVRSSIPAPQRRAMHIAAGGFHGMASLEGPRRARRVLMRRFGPRVRPRPGGLRSVAPRRGCGQAGLADYSIMEGVSLSDLNPGSFGVEQFGAVAMNRHERREAAKRVREARMAERRRRYEEAKARVMDRRRSKLSVKFAKAARVARRRPVIPATTLGHPAESLTGDALAGSFDGLGAAYGERLYAKERRRLPLTPGERSWLARDRAFRRRYRIARARRAVGMAEDGSGLEAKFFKRLKTQVKSVGTGAKTSLKKVSKVARKTAAFVSAATPLRYITKGGLYQGSLTQKEKQRAAKIGKPLAAAGAIAAGIVTGGALMPAVAGKLGAVKGVGGLVKTGLALRGKISSIRKSLGLPPITLRRGKQAEQEVEAAVAAGTSVEQAVEEAARRAAEDVGATAGTGEATYGAPAVETGAVPAEADVTVTATGEAPPAKAGIGAGAVLIPAALLGALFLFRGKKRS